MILHLLSKAIDAGVNIQTHTPVESVSSERDANGLWTATTPRGPIKAKTTVFASNGYTAGILPELEDKIVPVRGICSHIVSPKPHAPLLSNSYVLRFNDWEYDYLIPRTDGSIVVGGARRDYHADLNHWFGVHDDSTLIEPAKHYFDGYMQRHFHGWEDSEAYTESIWTGSKYRPDDNVRIFRAELIYCSHGLHSRRLPFRRRSAWQTESLHLRGLLRPRNATGISVCSGDRRYDR